MNVKLAEIKLAKLTNTELGQLQSAVCRELRRRSHTPQGEKPMMLGDPDGDVLWKHHGLTEVEAMDDAQELQ